MGYYSRIDLHDVAVRSDKRAEVAEAIAAHVRSESRTHWMVAWLRLEDDGSLCWNESEVGKWKSHEGFIVDLARWCSRGWVAFWSCEGDGGQWAYEFDGAGGYRECSARRVAALKAAATRRARAGGTVVSPDQTLRRATGAESLT